MSKAQITYRFEKQPESNDSKDVQEKQIELIEPILSEVPQTSLESIKKNDVFDTTWSEFPSDFGAWQSPFDTETEELEKLIRETNEAPDKKQNPFKMTQPEFDRSVVGPEVHLDESISRYTRHAKRAWGKMLITVCGAILTGVVFGFFVLSMFTSGGNGLETGGSTNAVSNDQHPISELTIDADNPLDLLEVDDVNNGNVMTPQEGMLAVNIPSKSFFVLQNGMFSTLESAETALQQLASSGFAATSEQQDNYYVYAGISANRDDALVMSHQLDEHDFETYIKMITLPSIRVVQWQGEPDLIGAGKIEDYFVQGNQLVEMISSLTVIQLQQATATAIDPAFMATVTEAHQSWNSLSSFVYDGMPEDYKPRVQKVNAALNTTMISLEAYKKNPSFSYLWQTQSALLDYVVLQKQLLESVGS